MKIVLNGERLTIDNPAGPELYTLNMIKALSRVDKQNNYTILLRETPNDWLQSELNDIGSNFEVKTINPLFSWTHLSLVLWLFKNKPDVFFTAVHTLPFLRPRKTKFVSMIHGLEHVYNKSNYKIFSFKPGTTEKFTIKHSDIVVVPSEFTAQAVRNSGWLTRNKKLWVIHEGVSEQFEPKSLEEIAAIKNKYNLTRDYFIFVSTIEPRKNLPKLIEALEILKNKRDIPDLLVVGKKGWGYDESLNAPAKFSVQDRVRFLGRIDTIDLIPLLSGARAYISPSFEEGFGLPVLEAMSCETPVILSNIPPYMDLASSAGFFFNPHNSNEIAKALSLFLDVKENELTSRIRLGKEVAKLYTWDKAATKLLEVLD